MTVIRLIKDYELGYGFSIARNSISKIRSNGPAEKAGLTIGDKILEINRISVEELPYSEIVELINESVTFLVLKIAEKVPDYTNSNEVNKSNQAVENLNYYI